MPGKSNGNASAQKKIVGPEDTCKIWKKVRELRLRPHQPERPLLVNNWYAEGVQGKAEVLAGVFSSASGSRHLPEEVARYRAEEESRFETPVMDSSTYFNGDLTLKELKAAVSGLGTASKATGEDPISYHMIRQFTEPMTKTLLKFYQTCWESGTVPSAWKEALVAAIPKKRKAKAPPDKLRAICPHTTLWQSVWETG